MTVSIHQPNLFPWIGYFDKIVTSDCFVILDHSVINIKNPNWFKRVFILQGGQKKPITVPLVKGEKGSFQKISEVQIDKTNPHWKKIHKTIIQSYSGHPYFDQHRDLLDRFFEDSETHLAKLNEKFVRQILKLLDFEKSLIRSSELSISVKSTEMLIEITQKLKGDTYLSGGGADGYMEPVKFEQAGLKLQMQDYSHPTYVQVGSVDFVPGLGIIDALFNLGAEELKKLL